MRRAILLTLIALASLATVVGASASSTKPCGKFIVGKANSSAFPGFKLPARGSQAGSSCKALKRIARRLHNGTYKIPKGSGATPPAYGKAFSVTDKGHTWTCRLQNRGSSGPTYAIKCKSGSARLRWHTGATPAKVPAG